MRGSSSAPEICNNRIVERVAEFGVDAVAGLNLPRVVLAPERAKEFYSGNVGNRIAIDMTNSITMAKVTYP